VTRPAAKDCLFITNIFPPAIGGSSQVYAALAALSAGGIAVLTSSHDHETGRERPDWREFDRQADYPVRRLKCIRPFLQDAYSGSRFAYRLQEAAIAAKLILATMFLAWRYRPKAVCIADDETVGWLVLVSKYLLGRRTLIYCHGDDLQCAEETVPRRSRWFGLADKIVAANQYSVMLLTARFGVPADKIVLIQNGVDLAAFYPGSTPSSLVQQYSLGGRRVLLTVTRLVPRKGVDKVLEALPAVANRFPDLIYLIAGDGPQREALQTMSQKLGVADLVKFIGRVEHGEIRDFYNAAEIVLLPNRAEDGESDGLPLVFLEANACAKPVIGGKAGGTAEVIRDGVNGFLVDGCDAGAIEAAICNLLGNEELRVGMGQKGLQFARGWDWRERARMFLQVCGP
jgi:phosphatidyl-myo-inositol dimannoside synthase